MGNENKGLEEEIEEVQALLEKAIAKLDSSSKLNGEITEIGIFNKGEMIPLR